MRPGSPDAVTSSLDRLPASLVRLLACAPRCAGALGHRQCGAAAVPVCCNGRHAVTVGGGHPSRCRWRQCDTARPAAPRNGYSLIEVLVALLLTSLLLVALGRVLATVSRTLQLRDSQAEMRERARYALAVLEPDLQMAGYYGLTSRGADFRWLQSGDARGRRRRRRWRRRRRRWPCTRGHPRVRHQLRGRPVNARAGRQQPLRAGPGRAAGCAASGGARRGSDTLTVRRAATPAVAADPGRLQLLVDRSDERRRWLLADGIAPAGAAPSAERLEWHDLQLDIYYISNDSVGAPGTPALRVKSLTRGVRPARLRRHRSHARHRRPARSGGSPTPVCSSPIRCRRAPPRAWRRCGCGCGAASAETGYRDTATYRYADVDAVPAAAEQGFRRLLVSRRIALRNAPP